LPNDRETRAIAGHAQFFRNRIVLLRCNVVRLHAFFASGKFLKRNRVQQIFIACVIAVLAVFALLAHREQRSAAAQAARPAPPALEALQLARAPAAEQGAQRVHTHEFPAALEMPSQEDFQQPAHWMQAHFEHAPGMFAPRATAMQLDSSCAGHALSQFSSVEQALSQLAGFNPAQMTPDDVLIEELVQFWQREARFYVLGGRWDRNVPAQYRITFFSAADAQFSKDVVSLPAPHWPSELTAMDIVSLGEYLDRVLQAEEAIGAKRGARLAHALPSVAQETHDIRLHNGLPVSWAFGDGRCQLRNSGIAHCRCLPRRSFSPVFAAQAHQARSPTNRPAEDTNRVID
jgi:hypothetical protein